MSYVLHVASVLRPGGGPAGYLYNLRSSLPAGQTRVLVDSLTEQQHRSAAVGHDGGRARGIKRLLGALRPDWAAARLCRKLLGSPIADADKLCAWQKAPVLVIHELPLLASYLPHKPAAQRLLYWPHSPTEWSAEFLHAPPANVMCWGPTVLSRLRLVLRRRELALIAQTDGLLASSREAFEGWFEQQASARHYIVSRIVDTVQPGAPALGTPQPPNRHSMPRVGFFGRLHTDKGFDLFQEVARAMPHVQFHCWGTGPLAVRPPVHGHGFTADIASAMASVDVVMVPNRRTYYDLVVLEALSLAKPVVLTGTGGFRELPHTDGIARCAPEAGALAAQVAALLERYPDGVCLANRQLFDERFCLEKFAERHIALAERLCDRPAASA